MDLLAARAARVGRADAPGKPYLPRGDTTNGRE
jgi:hypothetical protein